MKDKTTAGIFALLLGGIGAHHFYLNQTGRGLLYFLFAWTFIPSGIAFIEGIIFLAMDQGRFDEKYNAQRQLQQPQNIVVNVAANASNADSSSGRPAVASVAGEIKALHDLKLAGALTDEEFQEQKRRLLGQPPAQASRALGAAQARAIEPPKPGINLNKR